MTCQKIYFKCLILLKTLPNVMQLKSFPSNCQLICLYKNRDKIWLMCLHFKKQISNNYMSKHQSQ